MFLDFLSIEILLVGVPVRAMHRIQVIVGACESILDPSAPIHHSSDIEGQA
jgi:hypothetical protein